jgi:hypothetical protein
MAAGLLAAAVFGASQAQGGEVIQLVNGANQVAADTLNASGVFTTSFKGSNDVTITKLSGTMDPSVLDNFPATSAISNNPSYISSFIGSAANGTGDGTAGTFNLLQEQAGVSLQFDFSVALTEGDRIFVGDVDTSEIYSITAYSLSNGVYTAVSLASWTNQAFTGEAGELPNSQWATWNPTGGGATTGTFTSNTNGGTLTEPLDVLTPAGSISRVVITENAGPGTPALQFYSPGAVSSGVPEPASWALIILGLGGVSAATRSRRKLLGPVEALPGGIA